MSRRRHLQGRRIRAHAGPGRSAPLGATVVDDNAYCHDDESVWFDWSLVDRHADVHRFVTVLAARRVLRTVEHEQQCVSLTELIARATKSWHGVNLWQPDDRSRYNRASVEHAMGFCTREQRDRFLELCPEIERYIVEGGIILVKFWLEVSDKEQKRRFEARIKDPVRQWKLSPMDLPSREKWYAYSRARDAMLAATDTAHAPWHIVPSDDKRRARLNCIARLLELIPYERLPRKKVKLPKRSANGKRWRTSRVPGSSSRRSRQPC